MKKNITVIIPTLNSGKTIERCLSSLLNITDLLSEVLIIDGLSTDNTKEIVEKFICKIKNLCFYSSPDLGISDAYNKGISISNGHYILIIGSDDYINPIHFGKIFEYLQKSSDDIIFTGLYDEKNNLTFFPNLLEIKNRNSFIHPGTFITKNAYDLVGKYSLDYKTAMDYEFFSRFLKVSNSFSIFKMPFVIHAPGGISSQKLLCFLESFKIRKKFYNAKTPFREILNYGPSIVLRFLKETLKKLMYFF